MMNFPQARLKRILSASLILAGVLTIAAFALPSMFEISVADGFAFGVAAGGAIGSFNYFLLVRFGRQIFQVRPEPWKIAGRFVLRYGLLGLLIVLFVFVVKVDIIGLALGISNIPAAIALEALYPPGQPDECDENGME